MKAITCLVLAIASFGPVSALAQPSRNARENAITAQLNREQLAEYAQQAQVPPASTSSSTSMMAPPAATGQAAPPGARCGTDNPGCAQQLGNPAVNSASQLRLYHAQ